MKGKNIVRTSKEKVQIEMLLYKTRIKPILLNNSIDQKRSSLGQMEFSNTGITLNLVDFERRYLK